MLPRIHWRRVSRRLVFNTYSLKVLCWMHFKYKWPQWRHLIKSFLNILLKMYFRYPDDIIFSLLFFIMPLKFGCWVDNLFYIPHARRHGVCGYLRRKKKREQNRIIKLKFRNDFTHFWKILCHAKDRNRWWSFVPIIYSSAGSISPKYNRWLYERIMCQISLNHNNDCFSPHLCLFSSLPTSVPFYVWWCVIK